MAADVLLLLPVNVVAQGFIQYSLDCLVFQLRAAYINDFERIDRISERDNDFRISIMMWLRAHDRAPDDEWLTW